MNANRLRRCAAGLLLALGVAATGGSNSQAAAPAPMDWTGVWKRVGFFSFDPSIKPEHRENPPYRPDWEARYDQAVASAANGHPMADPTAACVPPGMPRVMNMVYPMEIIEKPKQLTIIAEWDSQVRRIFLDGRGHPADLDPTYNGHSIGHWEGHGAGRTLVVDTVGLRDDTVFDQTGIRHSDRLHVIERIRQVDANTLQDELTADDPVAFEKPWTVTKTFKRAPGENILEYVCEENNRNPIGSDGSTGVSLAKPTL